MATINIDDIQRDLLGYLRRVQDGETLLITQADKPQYNAAIAQKLIIHTRFLVEIINKSMI